MNIRKKIVSFAAAAVMCAAVAAAPVSAAEYQVSTAQVSVSEAAAGNTLLNSYKKEFGVKFNSKLAKKLETIDSKKTKTGITYSKSRTYNFWKKLTKATTSGKGFMFAMCDDKSLTTVGIKGQDARMVLLTEEGCLDMYLYSSGKAYICDPETKEAVLMETEENALASEDGTGIDLEEELNFNVDADSKGAVYKFTYNNEKYVFERFTDDSGNKVGFVFNSKGTPVMEYENGKFISCRITTSVKASWFEVPSDYTVMSMDEFMAEYN